MQNFDFTELPIEQNFGSQDFDFPIQVQFQENFELPIEVRIQENFDSHNLNFDSQNLNLQDFSIGMPLEQNFDSHSLNFDSQNLHFDSQNLNLQDFNLSQDFDSQNLHSESQNLNFDSQNLSFDSQSFDIPVVIQNFDFPIELPIEQNFDSQQSELKTFDVPVEQKPFELQNFNESQNHDFEPQSFPFPSLIEQNSESFQNVTPIEINIDDFQFQSDAFKTNPKGRK